MKFPTNGSWPANSLLVLAGILLGGSFVWWMPSNGNPSAEGQKNTVAHRTEDANKAPHEGNRRTTPAGPATDSVANTPQTLPSALELTDPRKRAEVLRELGMQMARRDLQGALRHGNELARPQDRLDFLRGVFGEWSETDPEGALEHAWRHFEGGLLKTEVISLVVNKWGAENPHDAWLWVDQHLSGPTREQAMSDLMIGWTRRSPAEAAQWLAQTGITSNALYTATALTWAEQDPEASLAWTQTLPAVRARDAARNAIAAEYGRQDPVAAAAAFAEDLQVAENKLELATILTDVWATNDPAATAQWLDTLPIGAVREQAAGILATIWATHDVEGALAWANSLEDTALRQRVVTHLGTTWGGIDPVGAIEWLLTLPPTEASSGLAGAMNVWAATDAIGMYAWIEQNSDPGISDLARRSLGDVITQEDMLGAMELANNIIESNLRSDTLTRYFRHWRQKDNASANEWFMLYGPSLDDSSRRRIAAEQKRPVTPGR